MRVEVVLVPYPFCLLGFLWCRVQGNPSRKGVAAVESSPDATVVAVEGYLCYVFGSVVVRVEGAVVPQVWSGVVSQVADVVRPGGQELVGIRAVHVSAVAVRGVQAAELPWQRGGLEAGQSSVVHSAGVAVVEALQHPAVGAELPW